jgi:hypothetical protein
MRSQHEGMSLWFEPNADAPGEAVPVGIDVKITVAVEPADASNRVEVRYRVNQGPVEKVVAEPVRHIGDAQYFRACLPASALHAGDRVEYLAICRCVARQVPSQKDEERFVASFRVVGAEPNSVSERAHNLSRHAVTPPPAPRSPSPQQPAFAPEPLRTSRFQRPLSNTSQPKEPTPKVEPNKPLGTCRVAPLAYDAVKDKGVTASAIAHASWTWGQGTYFPSNLIKTMAQCPRLAQTEVDYANAFIFDEEFYLNGVQQAGFVDRCLKELLITCVALTNRCRYTTTHHSFIGYSTYENACRLDEYLPKFLHLHEDDLTPYRANYTELEYNLIIYAKKICRDPHTITDEEIRRIKRLLGAYNLKRKDGLSDEANERLINSQMVEITWLISHFCLLTRWFTALQVEDEGEEAEVNFLKLYAETVPPEIIARNNHVLGDSF